MINLILIFVLTCFKSAKHSSFSAVFRASEYLASKLDQITDPFQMAITAYALQASRHSHRTTAYTLLKEMQRTSQLILS